MCSHATVLYVKLLALAKSICFTWQKIGIKLTWFKLVHYVLSSGLELWVSLKCFSCL